MDQAPPKAGEKKRDRALYARLVESYQADRVSIFVDFDRLNNPRSPVWSPWENIGPLLVILIGSLALMFFNMLVGLATMLLGVLFYLFMMRPWIAQRVYRRSIEAATEKSAQLEFVVEDGRPGDHAQLYEQDPLRGTRRRLARVCHALSAGDGVGRCRGLQQFQAHGKARDRR